MSFKGLNIVLFYIAVTWSYGGLPSPSMTGHLARIFEEVIPVNVESKIHLNVFVSYQLSQDCHLGTAAYITGTITATVTAGMEEIGQSLTTLHSPNVSLI